MGIYFNIHFEKKICIYFCFRIQMRQLNSSLKTEPIQCDINRTISPHEISSILQTMCPLIVIFLQFSITSMFMWMLCEGIHLNNVLTVSVFENHFKTYYFHIIGWGKSWFDLFSLVKVCLLFYISFLIVAPFCIILTWSIIMFVKERSRK